MSWEDSEYITLTDVWAAYRKAKVDLYYERGHPYLFDICEYEKNLTKNLSKLHKQLNSNSLRWMTAKSFVGVWSVMAKSIDIGLANSSCMISDPDKAWDAMVTAKGEDRLVAQFRIVGKHSIDFAVVSTIWMHKVGHLYDGVLGTNSYGTRMRRAHSDDPEHLGKPNTLSLGTFVPYLSPFGKWRSNGLAAMRSAVDAGKRVVAITADVRQFYHRIGCDFLLDDNYLKRLDLDSKIETDDVRFTRAIIDAIHAWSEKTPIHKDDPSVGLPVGLPAARLIANVSLAELDRVITKELTPIYYGRYVDDIMLVLENTRDFMSASEVWDWIIERCKGLLVRSSGEKTDSIMMKASYLGASRVEFIGSKQKVFFLEGDAALSVIGSIERQMRERASEWRMLPDMPSNSDGLSSDLAKAYDQDGDAVDNLRKTDSVSLRRAAFAIRLRDIEAFEHDLPPEQWLIQREAFYKSIMQHVLVLPRFINDFEIYLPRLIGLAVACQDFEYATKMLQRVLKTLNQINKDCILVAVGGKEGGEEILPRLIFKAWKERIVQSTCEAIAAAAYAIEPKICDAEKINEILKALQNISPLAQFESVESLLKTSQDMFLHDLSRLPYRHKLLKINSHSGKTISQKAPPCINASACHLSASVIDGITILLKVNKNKLPKPLLFPTRPFSVPELYLVFNEGFSSKGSVEISKLILALRGFKPDDGLPRLVGEMISVPHADSKRTGKKRIAVVSWKTEMASWTASVCGLKDPDQTRCKRLNDVFNNIMRMALPPDYVILPELSIPSSWFIRISTKLAHRGISLISGVEYLHHGRRLVANQVWASLVSDFLGFNSNVIYRQDKKRPAIHEEAEIYRLAHRRLKTLTNPNKPCVKHDDFIFALLVCSELTNLQYRVPLRGAVDAVFVPEWNQDTEQFSPLVESAACDMHSYIVQCNDRQYGDSRIRAPAKDAWKRDIVRVKGGVEDYFVVGEIDYYALREFQSVYRSDLSERAVFKPVPDGFVIKRSRKRLPKSV